MRRLRLYPLIACGFTFGIGCHVAADGSDSIGTSAGTDRTSDTSIGVGGDMESADTTSGSQGVSATGISSGDTAGSADDTGVRFDVGRDTDGGPGAAVECEGEDNPIYLITHATPQEIYSFDPPNLTFSPALTIDCPDTGNWTVSSMAVDRFRRAWIQWGAPSDGSTPYVKRLDRIDLDTGACETDVAPVPANSTFTTPLGMAFVADGAQQTGEDLYFISSSTFTYQLGGDEALGPFYVFQPGEGTAFGGAELTGTGEGRLFTLIMNWTPQWDHPCTAETPCFPTVHLGEIDKTDGSSISNVELSNVPAFGASPGGFAFAHWGGQFWIFEDLNFGPTRVYRYDPLNDATTAVVHDGPAGIVGAGVSTCAPIIFPAG